MIKVYERELNDEITLNASFRLECDARAYIRSRHEELGLDDRFFILEEPKVPVLD